MWVAGAVADSPSVSLAVNLPMTFNPAPQTALARAAFAEPFL